MPPKQTPLTPSNVQLSRGNDTRIIPDICKPSFRSEMQKEFAFCFHTEKTSSVTTEQDMKGGRVTNAPGCRCEKGRSCWRRAFLVYQEISEGMSSFLYPQHRCPMGSGFVITTNVDISCVQYTIIHDDFAQPETFTRDNTSKEVSIECQR